MGAIHDRFGREFAIGAEVRENWSSVVGTILTPGRDACLVRWPSGRRPEWVNTGFLVVVVGDGGIRV